MKFYIYISKTKIDMLFPQTNSHNAAKVSRELNINAKLVNFKQKKEYDPEGLFAKTHAVSQYIRSHEKVGTISKPASYICDELDMYIVPLEAGSLSSGIVTVLGSRGDTIVILGASKQNFIGHSYDTCDPLSIHFIMIFSDYLGKSEWTDSMTKRATKNTVYGMTFFSHCVDFLCCHKREHACSQNLEFLAKTLTTGIDDHSRKQIVIATPVYIAAK